MTNLLVLVLVLLGAALYFMTAVERTRFLQATLAVLRTAKDTITWQKAQDDPFFAALRARHPRVVATPVLIVLNAVIFIFIPSPALDLVISAACLLQIGLILERLAGRAAYTTVYLASGIAAGIASLSMAPGRFSVAPSGAILGMYGLLLVTSTWTTFNRSSLAIPLNVAKRLAPVAAVFLLYKLMAGGWNVAALAPFLCGVVGGVVVARDLNEGAPRIRDLARAMATVLVAVALYAAATLYRPPVDATTDVRAEIDRVIAIEDRTASLYDQEVIRFRKGRTTTAALIDVIDRTIVPQLRAAAGRLRALDNVSAEDQRVIAAAERFLKIRDESWRLRATALHNSDILGLRKADGKEQASREAFDRLKMPG